MGYGHPDVLLASLDASQVADWLAYMTVEPFGPLRDDLRAGVLAHTLAAVNGAKGLSPGSFFPSLVEPGDEPAARRPVGWRKVLAFVKALTRSEGGKVRDDG